MLKIFWYEVFAQHKRKKRSDVYYQYPRAITSLYYCLLLVFTTCVTAVTGKCLREGFLFFFLLLITSLYYVCYCSDRQVSA